MEFLEIAIVLFIGVIWFITMYYAIKKVNKEMPKLNMNPWFWGGVAFLFGLMGAFTALIVIFIKGYLIGKTNKNNE